MNPWSMPREAFQNLTTIHWESPENTVSPTIDAIRLVTLPALRRLTVVNGYSYPNELDLIAHWAIKPKSLSITSLVFQDSDISYELLTFIIAAAKQFRGLHFSFPSRHWVRRNSRGQTVISLLENETSDTLECLEIIETVPGAVEDGESRGNDDLSLKSFQTS